MELHSIGPQYLSRRLSLDSHIRTNNLKFYLGDHIDTLSHIGKDDFQVSLDVVHFQPNEISVRIDNDCILVHAEHKEKRDPIGHLSREFTRRYEVPDGFNVEEVTANLSSDGILTIEGQRKNPAVPGKFRVVPIQHSGPARLNVATIKDENKLEDAK